MTKNNTPFFIVGSGRSGTTLLRLILTGHSRLQIPPETWFIVPLVEKFSLTDVLSAGEVEAVVAVITGHRRWPDMKLNAEELSQDTKQLTNAKLVDVINLVYRKQLKSTSKSRFGDKTPIYINIMPQLNTLYPGAKFIHLIRDGRDVAISRIDADWERYHDTEFPWTRAMNLRRSYIGSSIERQILEVRYESLVSNLEDTVRGICEFLEEDFEPAMLEWRGLTSQVPERDQHLHKKLNQPVSDSAVGVWQRKLSAGECFLMEACLHKDLADLGYKLRFSNVLWRPFLKASSYVVYGLSPLLRRGIPALQRRNLLPKTLYI